MSFPLLHIALCQMSASCFPCCFISHCNNCFILGNVFHDGDPLCYLASVYVWQLPVFDVDAGLCQDVSLCDNVRCWEWSRIIFICKCNQS